MHRCGVVVHRSDKLVFYALIAGLGLPAPGTRALCHGGSRFAAVPVLAQPDALAAHLRTAMAG